ncbi:MAG TPA: hypothetical protein VJR25_09015 [Microbacterium sp.]|uniref:hypothetical protein n=1 Tax=Microbacterium sp. TaxID=51671 RepID=UPI002B46565E|nr:hypothetical protein [Microbacterium sp.]HKT56900.1 hypothetical protein [Microbacterium sp.]
MSHPALAPTTRGRARVVILVVDFVLVLFPPLQWAIAPGPASLWYYLGANALVVVSLFALWGLRDRTDADADLGAPIEEVRR